MSDEKKCLLSDAYKAIVFDVAGTTSSIGFIKDTLLPFAASNADEFLKTNWEDEIVKEAVKTLNTEKDLNLEEATKLFKEFTEASSSNAGLKTLQGLIYKKGYDGGDIKAHVFDDVAPTFELLSKTHKIAIYSTGSIESQKLLFANTINGDLTKHISKYYDQEIGAKTESESYKKISDDLEIKPEEIVFITDSVNEAKAAQSAKFEAILVEREGNEQLDDETKKEFKIITTFTEITFEASAKRKNEDEPVTTEQERPAKVAKIEENETVKATEPPKETETEAMEVDNVAAKEEKPLNEVEKKSEETVKEVEAEESKTKEAENEESKTKMETQERKTKAETESKTKETEVESETKEVVTETETKAAETVDSAEISEKPTAEPEKMEQTDSKTDEAQDKKPEEIEAEKETVVVVEEEKETVADKTKETEEIESEKKMEEPEKEKENKSELANGACETEKNGEVNGKTEEGKAEETEIKVKKLEETGETTSVSVEA